MRRVLVLVGALALAIGGLGPPPAVAASPFEGVVVGELTPPGPFNPEAASIAIPVTIPQGSGVVVQFSVVPTVERPFDQVSAETSESGDVVIPGLTPDRPAVVSRLCDASGACVAGPSQRAIVVTALRLSLRPRTGQPRVAPGTTVDLQLADLVGQPEDITAEYRFNDPVGGQLLASGPAPVVVERFQHYVRIPVPQGLVQGRRYEVDVDAVVESDRLGRLAVTDRVGLRADLRVDGVSVLAAGTTLYPHPDDFRDEVAVLLGFDLEEDAVIGGRVLDRAGRVVRSGLPVRGDDRGYRVGWRGQDEDGDTVPPGRYTLLVDLTDVPGNVRTLRFPVAVSAQRVVRRTVKVTLAAQRALVDRSVGGCSRLRGLGGGALAFESQVGCTDPRRSVVAAVFGLRLPEVPYDLRPGYARLRLSAQGRGLPGRRTPYIIMGYLQPPRGRFVLSYPWQRTSRLELRTVDDADPLIWRDGEERAVYWQLGLTDGSRWRVDRFQVEVTFRGLSAR